jgi:AcrR family transcriptional regulator
VSWRQKPQTDGKAQIATGRKETQRDRLVSAAIDIAASSGYAAATIASVIASAGVSRPTFYDYFADKDDCLLAAAAVVHQRLLATVAAALARDPAEHAVPSAIVAVVEFAISQPAAARVLMNETLAGGPRALDGRDAQILELAQLIEGALARATSDPPTPDMPMRVLIGAIHRILAARLRGDKDDIHSMTDELPRWSASYEVPASRHRWSDLTPSPPAAPSPLVAQTPLRPPAPLRAGRRHSREEVVENHRRRLMFATAEAALAKGYTATSVSDIVRIAGLDHNAFTSVFADKEAAYLAVAEYAFERTMAVTAGAFFTGDSWPERTWEAGRAFTQFLQNNPTLAVAFVESYAVGPQASKRVDGLLNAFTMFLQHGYEDAREDRHPSPVALEAIAMANFEMCYHQMRGSVGPRITELQPHSMFFSLAPFIGPAEANRFVEEKLAENVAVESPPAGAPESG